jgi:hypothetical protein
LHGSHLEQPLAFGHARATEKKQLPSISRFPAPSVSGWAPHEQQKLSRRLESLYECDEISHPEVTYCNALYEIMRKDQSGAEEAYFKLLELPAGHPSIRAYRFLAALLAQEPEILLEEYANILGRDIADTLAALRRKSPELKFEVLDQIRFLRFGRGLDYLLVACPTLNWIGQFVGVVQEPFQQGWVGDQHFPKAPATCARIPWNMITSWAGSLKKARSAGTAALAKGPSSRRASTAVTATC